MNDLLGRRGRDIITGFEGTITGHCNYLTGCSQVLMAPPAKDGAYVDSQWFDVQRVALTEDEAVVLDNGPTPGCDRAAPKR
ncbi:hypothetical protein [Sphingobium aromaticiconvertens]|uniref:hypothetical protein n=1 Tax=Sphingobium aromaticiconvertens TaxID=365341 RepID=UPI00301AFF7C